MQCVEFETRLNDRLDERLSLFVDTRLVDHAQNCPGCSELLAAHELLLEGVQALPTVGLSDGERQAFAHRIAAEVGSAPLVAFRADDAVEFAPRGPTVVATNGVARLALIGLVLATAAAVLIVVLPRFRDDPQPDVPGGKQPLIAGTQDPPSNDSPDQEAVLKDYEDLAPIAWVGYQVADGLTPVTNSMVSALRELRKRPFFRNVDEQQRSSYYSPREVADLVA